MAYKVQKPCKVCGKMFTPCFDCEQDKTAFHWRTVACSQKCGKEFLRLVLEDRTVKDIPKKDIPEPDTYSDDKNVEDKEYKYTYKNK